MKLHLTAFISTEPSSLFLHHRSKASQSVPNCTCFKQKQNLWKQQEINRSDINIKMHLRYAIFSTSTCRDDQHPSYYSSTNVGANLKLCILGLWHRPCHSKYGLYTNASFISGLCWEVLGLGGYGASPNKMPSLGWQPFSSSSNYKSDSNLVANGH